MDKNGKKGGASDKYKNKFVRIPQKVFNPEVFKPLTKTNLPDLYNKEFYVVKKQHFRKGFLFKAFP